MSYPHLVMPQVMNMLFQANAALHAVCRSWGAEDPARYVRDFRTIRLNYGQRTGKTVYMKSAAAPDDLVVVYDEQAMQWYSEGEHSKAHVITIESLLRNMLINKQWPTRYSRIWLEDWPRLCYNTEKSILQTWEQQLRLYQCLVHDVDQQFIILG